MTYNKKQPIATEIYNGYPCFIMPSEPDPEAERWVFVPKVRITGNIAINPDGIAGPFVRYVTPKD